MHSVFMLFMVSLKLAIALWVIGARSHMSYACQPNVVFEISRYKLRPVIADDFWMHAGIFLQSPLYNKFDISFFHLLFQLIMNDCPAESVEDTAQIIKGSATVDVRYVDVPIIMSMKRLHKSSAFLRRAHIAVVKHASLRKYSIRCRRTNRYNVCIHHHIATAAITIKRMLLKPLYNQINFLRCNPVITWNLCIMFIRFSIAFTPIIKTTVANPRLPEDPVIRQAGLLMYLLYVVNNSITQIQLNPAV